MSFLSEYRLAGRSQMGGQAIDSSGDPHLAKGIHIRVLSDPDLGLPVEPFGIYRVDLGTPASVKYVRADIDWRDSRGFSLLPPFNVTPGNPVTGYLPPQAVCCWAQIIFQRVRRPPVGPTGPVGPVILAAPRRGAGAERPMPSPFSDLQLLAAVSDPLRIEALMTTETGATVIAARNKAPFELTATPIERIRITGTASIAGVHWIDSQDLLKDAVGRIGQQQPWRRMGFPVTSAPHYTGLPNAKALCDERVLRGAPLRFGLHDRPEVDGPQQSPPATPQDEAARVGEISATLQAQVTSLLNSNNPKLLTEIVPIDPASGSSGTLTFGLLDSVLQSLIEPGVAKFLGFADVDTEPLNATSGRLLAYVVTGAWEFFEPIDNVVLIDRRCTTLCATVGQPPLTPGAPLIGQPVPLGFRPVTPPQALREIKIPISGITESAGLALARKLAADIVSLNTHTPLGRARDLYPDNSEESTTTEFRDRTAPPDAVVYRAAQHDWFGRWSEWAERAAPESARPGPPRPLVQASYEPPIFGSPIPSQALRGTIHVLVPVPPVSSLSPGARLLNSLELNIAGIIVNVPIVDPANPPQQLTAQRPGPPIERAGERTIQITARWRDSANVFSQPSEPRTLVLHDPRPGAAISFPPVVRYTARPDSTGLARVRLQWTAAANHSAYRVFYTDERRLLRGLETLSSQGGPTGTRASQTLQQLAETSDAPARAVIFQGQSSLFGRDLFEQISVKPVPNPGGAGPMSFDHAVSGALRVLSFYRVVSLTGAQVEAPFTDGSLAAFRVPNTTAPQRPGLSVRPIITPGGGFEARLEITVPVGNVPAIEYRLRRVIEGARDVSSMLVVGTGAIPLPTGDPGVQTVVVVDTGSSPLAPAGKFRSWTRYAWAVEVRGANEPGGGPPGQWSPPSAVAAHMFVPPTPPPPPSVDDFQSSATEVELAFSLPSELAGFDEYIFEIYRQPPGKPARELASIPSLEDASGVFTFVDSAPSGPGTAYQIVLRDPIGRRSRPSTAQIVGGV